MGEFGGMTDRFDARVGVADRDEQMLVHGCALWDDA
jgi:hypothetical protein